MKRPEDLLIKQGPSKRNNRAHRGSQHAVAIAVVLFTQEADGNRVQRLVDQGSPVGHVTKKQYGSQQGLAGPQWAADANNR
ncbi:hypothetical protein EYF80_032827 [Liparis tanakae]|uniref:Uncharacterized protein n=1 Tax=Liparis tanakae TaxID=230148 RepID=A0A4Z2GU28_9TELE|nr:hypothetical protein EYF80_032827 [Liparis tanakae]